MFHDRSLLERCFQGFILLVLEYCSAVWCSTTVTHHKLLDRVVNGARFLTMDVFECDIVHRRLLQFCVCCIRSDVLLSVSLCNDLADPVFDGVRLAGFNGGAYAFLLA